MNNAYGIINFPSELVIHHEGHDSAIHRIVIFSTFVKNIWYFGKL